MNANDELYLRIKDKAMAAGTSPRLVVRRINDGWSEDEAINKELRTKWLCDENLKSANTAPSFLPAKCKPLVIPEGPMPETAGPKLMAQALEASYKVKGIKVDGETRYTKKIRELIEGTL